MTEQILWSPGVTLEAIEQQVIIKAFAFYQGNKTATSQALGIAIRTLDSKLEKYEAEANERKRREEEYRAREQQFLDRQRGVTRAINDSPEERDAQRRSVLHSPEARLRVESPASATAEPAVSVPERKEVQKVLPRQAPKGRAVRSG